MAEDFEKILADLALVKQLSVITQQQHMSEIIDEIIFVVSGIQSRFLNPADNDDAVS